MWVLFNGSKYFAILNIIFYGLNSCKTLGIYNLIIEMEYFYNLHIVLTHEGVFGIPEAFYMICDIKVLMAYFHISISIILKVTNAYARWLSSFSASLYGFLDLLEYNSSVPFRGLLNLDKNVTLYVSFA